MAVWSFVRKIEGQTYKYIDRRSATFACYRIVTFCNVSLRIVSFHVAKDIETHTFSHSSPRGSKSKRQTDRQTNKQTSKQLVLRQRHGHGYIINLKEKCVCVCVTVYVFFYHTNVRVWPPVLLYVFRFFFFQFHLICFWLSYSSPTFSCLSLATYVRTRNRAQQSNILDLDVYGRTISHVPCHYLCSHMFGNLLFTFSSSWCSLRCCWCCCFFNSFFLFFYLIVFIVVYFCSTTITTTRV